MTTFAEIYGLEVEELMDFLIPCALNIGLRQDAEDAVHDTYIRMARAQRAEPIRNGKAYAYRVLTNIAKQRGKAKDRLTTLMEPDDLAIAAETHASTEGDLHRQLVHSPQFDRMLEEVSDAQAEVMALRFRPNGQVRPYQEIAELTGRTPEALRRSFHDGVERLRRNRGVLANPEIDVRGTGEAS